MQQKISSADGLGAGPKAVGQGLGDHLLAGCFLLGGGELHGFADRSKPCLGAKAGLRAKLASQHTSRVGHAVWGEGLIIIIIIIIIIINSMIFQSRLWGSALQVWGQTWRGCQGLRALLQHGQGPEAVRQFLCLPWSRALRTNMYTHMYLHIHTYTTTFNVCMNMCICMYTTYTFTYTYIHVHMSIAISQ